MATSALQKYTSERLQKLFGEYGVVENTRPDWLISSRGERLELDFFIDKLSVAIEVQDKQHLEFTPHFHKTIWDFQDQQRRDYEKKELCNKAGIVLLEVIRKADVAIALAKIQELIDRRLSKKPDKWADEMRMYPKGRKSSKSEKHLQRIFSYMYRHEEESVELSSTEITQLAESIEIVTRCLKDETLKFPGRKGKYDEKLQRIERARLLVYSRVIG
jgi:hypothetical protein